MNKPAALTSLFVASLLAVAGCRDASNGPIVPEHSGMAPKTSESATIGMNGSHDQQTIGVARTGDGRLMTAGLPATAAPAGTSATPAARGGGPADGNVSAPDPQGLAPDQHIGTPSFRPFRRGTVDNTGHVRLYER